MARKQTMALAGAALVAATGLGAGVALASNSPGHLAAGETPTPASSASPGYSWYRSMMSSRYGPSVAGMLGSTSDGSYGWMMSEAGYQWMTGSGTASPGWMTEALPSAMMGGAGMMGVGAGADPGKIMGTLWANASGPRISAAEATALGNQVPAGAQVSQADNTITGTARTVRLTVLASPASGPDETFRAAGLVNPRIVVSAGARVVIRFVNADADTAHGLVITAGTATGGVMPMMTARPAFDGSALWFLGDPTSAGMHEGVLDFTATTPGSYRYLCPVPGHAQKGMAGVFIVE